VPGSDGAWTISLRVPAGASSSADAFCRRFPGGGGRAIAAGVDRVAPADLDALLRAFLDAYAGGP
jgi:hypothetical protein